MKNRREILFDVFPKLLKIHSDWRHEPLPNDQPFDAYHIPALTWLQLLTKALRKESRRWERSERFEHEIKFLAADEAMYSGRSMSDYITRLVFIGVEERKDNGGQSEFKVVDKDPQLSRDVFNFCANKASQYLRQLENEKVYEIKDTDSRQIAKFKREMNQVDINDGFVEWLLSQKFKYPPYKTLQEDVRSSRNVEGNYTPSYLGIKWDMLNHGAGKGSFGTLEDLYKEFKQSKKPMLCKTSKK